jgi:hypothetical protein
VTDTSTSHHRSDGAGRASVPSVRNGSAIAASVLVTVALSSGHVLAGEASDSQRARALFEEAGELERQGQWGAAQERLRTALRLRETPHLHYALGWALENDDRLVDAKAEYETAVRMGRERAGGEEAARLANARLTEIDKVVPIVKVRVAGASKSNARVIVDGREIRRDNDTATVPVNPGSHVVRVERDGEGAFEQIVYVGRSTVRNVNVDASSGTPAPREVAQDRHGRLPSRPTVPQRKTADHGNSVVPWLLLSGGLAFIAGGSALLLSASADSDRQDALQSKWCSLTSCTTPGGAQAESAEAVSYRRAADEAAEAGATKEVVGLVLGGAGLIAGSAGAFLLLRGEERTQSGSTRRTPTHARASAMPLPGGAMATAAFTF